MSRSILLALLFGPLGALIVSPAFTSVTGDAAAAGPVQLSVAEWRDDLEQVIATIREHHPSPFGKLPEEEFARAAAGLREEIPVLGDAEIVLRMAALVAALEDGHTRLALPRRHPELALTAAHSTDPEPRVADLRFHALPVTLTLFDDGLWVTAAEAGHEDLLGVRVLRVGGRDAEGALEAVRHLTYRDNEQGFKLQASDRLSLVEVLVHVGIVAAGDEVPLTVAGADGTERTVTLRPLVDGPLDWRVIKAHSSEPPRLLRDTGEHSWWGYESLFYLEHRPEERAIYVQINKIDNDPAEPLAALTARVVAMAEERDAERVVLDLRKNHGGSGSWNRALVLGMVRNGRLDRYGSLYVLIGRRTFSAAVKLVGELERYAQVIFVGEPTGSPLTHFGDPRKITLEHSGLTLRVSTIPWQSWLAGDNRPWVEPHLDAPFRFVDLVAGRDLVLEAALNYRAPEGLIASFRDLMERKGANKAAIHLVKHASDPATSTEDLEGQLAGIGAEYLEAGEIEAGLYTHMMGVRLYPDSADLLAGLGKALEAAGQPERALGAYRQALAIQPDHPAAASGSRRLEGDRK